MSACLSTYLKNKLADHALGHVAYTSPTTAYVALFSTQPGEGNTGTELVGTGYARQAFGASAATAGETHNSADVVFTQGAAWPVAVGFAIYDALTAGNMLVFGSLTTPTPAGANLDTVTIPATDLSVTLS
jgi:hypothetical protein